MFNELLRYLKSPVMWVLLGLSAGGTVLVMSSRNVTHSQSSISGGSVSIMGALPTGTNQIGIVSADPCASAQKSSAFANITTATTTALVSVSGSTVVYVCGYTLDLVATIAPDTVILEQGTGAACSGSPVSLTPTHNSGILTSGAAFKPVGFAGQTVFKTSAANGLCAVSTVGTGPAIGVFVSYVQQ